MRRPVASVICCALLATGCQLSSKWALDNPSYAKKYDRPYTERGWKKHRRMAKQMVDARFVAEESGLYASTQGEFDQQVVAGAELGAIYFPSASTSARVGVGGLISGTNEEGRGRLGLEGGLRWFVPARLAPFVGIGGFIGGSEKEVASLDYGPLEEADETSEKSYQSLSALYPEVGVGLWLNGNLQLMLHSRYYVSSQGRDADTWSSGLGFVWLGNHPTPPSDPNNPEAIEVDQLNDHISRLNQAITESADPGENPPPDDPEVIIRRLHDQMNGEPKPSADSAPPSDKTIPAAAPLPLE